jgi:hypothetical protein|tara:strand:+ start:113 stop:1054 length:942 start_codon:yes stop_codon:yes gene_type:complete
MSEEAGDAPAEAAQEGQESETEEVSEDYTSSDSESQQYNKSEDQEEQARENSDEENPDSLEAKMDGKEQDIEEDKEINLVQYLKNKGFSSEKIAQLLAAKETYSAKDMPSGPRSLIYLIKGFLENTKEGDEDVYKKIEESGGTHVLYFPGLMNFPYGVDQIEEHTGLNVIRVETRDPEEIKAIIDHAYATSGQKPVLVGYSDGGKTITKAVEALGSDIRDYVSEIFFVAANKEPGKVPGIIYIDGANDKLAPIEKGYNKGIDQESVRIMLPDMGHVDLAYNPIAIGQIGSIIRDYTSVRNDFLPVSTHMDKAA